MELINVINYLKVEERKGHLFKKLGVIVLLVTCTSLYANTGLSLDGRLQYSPLYYDPLYQLDNANISTSWQFGLILNQLSFGLGVFSDYTSINGLNIDTQLQGAWFNLGGSVFLRYQVLTWLRFSLNTGLFWNQSAFNYNASGWLQNSIPVHRFQFNTLLNFYNIVYLELINRLDMNFFENELLDNAVFRTGARFSIDFGLNFLRPFFELNAYYFNYKSEILTKGIETWAFQGQLGVSIHWKTVNKETLNKSIKNKDDNYTSDSKLIEDLYISEINSLKKAQVGDSVSFYSIIFDDIELTKNSKIALDAISTLLIDNPAFTLSIQGYSAFFQDPIKELEFCNMRAEKIIEYLTLKGVKKYQVRQDPVGNIIQNQEFYTKITVILK